VQPWLAQGDAKSASGVSEHPVNGRAARAQFFGSATNAADAAVGAEAWRTLVDALDTITERAGDAELTLPEAICEWDKWIELVGRLSFPAAVVDRVNRLKSSD
jgi:hypothetical protein